MAASTLVRHALILFCVSTAPYLRAEETALPKSIIYTQANGHHTYSFTGLYHFPMPNKEDEKDDAASWASWYYPAVISATVNHKAGTFSVTTSEKLSMEKLREGVDKQARETGEMPYWAELVWRDRKKAENFSKDRFKVTPVKVKAIPRKYAWSFANRRKPLELPFQTDGQLFTFVVSRASAHCMAHDRYAIRVLDESGAIVWENQDLVVEVCCFALMDQNEDDVPEIFVDREDHGKEERFVITYSK
jgi:hypothetical protein